MKEKLHAFFQNKTRAILLIAAIVIFIGAVVWYFILSGTGAQSVFCSFLRGYGYHVVPEDIFIAADEPDTTIRLMLSDADLNDAIDASKKAGLPSDITKRGNVTLLLVALSNGDVITTYLVDAEPELAFIEIPDTHAVYPLGETHDTQNQTGD